MTVRVHLSGNFKPDFINRLKTIISPDIKLNVRDNIKKPIPCDILVAGVPERELVKNNPDLRILVIPWAGLPRKTEELMRDFPHIAIHNLHHNAVPTAEMAVTMMLSLCKDILRIDRSFRDYNWTRRYVSPGTICLLRDKKALILGYGSIGKKIASLCAPFGIELHAIRRNYGFEKSNPVELHQSDDLLKILPEMDMLFVSLPLTGRTRGIIGREELAALPDSAIVINVSRGEVIQEEALFEELNKGRIKAGLDVWYTYPHEESERSHTPPSQYPFHELENVIMTPHLAGHSDRTETLRAEALARLLNLAVEDKQLPDKVSLDQGY